MPNCRTLNVKVAVLIIRSFKIFIIFKCEFCFVLPFGKTRAQNFELRNWEVTYLKAAVWNKIQRRFVVFWAGATANPSKNVDWKWSTDKFIIKWLFRNPYFSKHNSFNQFFVSTWWRPHVSKYLPGQQKYVQNCLLMIFWILKRYRLFFLISIAQF